MHNATFAEQRLWYERYPGAYALAILDIFIPEELYQQLFLGYDTPSTEVHD